MKKAKRFLAMLLVAALAVSVVGCSSSDSDSSEEEAAESVEAEGAEEEEEDSEEESADTASSNQLIVAAETDVVTLDPGHCYEVYANMMMRMCYDTLFELQYDVDGPQPCLATGIEYSEDGMTATVTIRDDAVFASGNPVTAEDVQFSIMRCKNLQGNPAFICDGIDSIDVIDDYTVQFNLNAPDSSLPAKLTYVSTSIIDSELAKEQGATDAEDAAMTDTAQDYFDEGNSLGSGPYVLASYTVDEEFVFERNENYYEEGTSIDRIVIKEMDDSNTQMMSLSQGDIDIALNLNADTVEELEGAEGVRTESFATMTLGFLYMNMDEEIGGPVSDPLVQQAVRLALDYDGIQQVVGEGSITPVSYIQKGLLGASEEVRDSSYRDLDRAKELLEEAGYPDGFEIDFPCNTLAPEGIPLTDLAQKIAADLSEIGITLNIQTIDWTGGYADDYRNGDLGFTIMYWSPDYLDPNSQLEFLPGGIVGLRAGWTEEMDPDLAAYRTSIASEMDDDVRVELLAEMQEATAEYGPIIPIVQYPKYIGSNENLTNVNFNDTYRVDLRKVDWQ